MQSDTKESTSTMVRIPRDLKEWLVAKAVAEDRSLNQTIRRILEAARKRQMSRGTETNGHTITDN